MRSTVSYMLSHSGSELVMSHPDYDIQTYHHGCLLVLLRGIGPSKPRSLQRVFEKVRRINNVKIVDSSGNTRDIWVRYIHEHPVENNDWGDFQTHRRLLGLITIGKFENQVELNELCRLHESLKVKYTNTLYDSRCILFGPTESENLEQDFKPPDNFKSRAFFYKENDTCNDLDTHITEFANSLFYILESKRLERSREKVDKFSLLQAPFEKRDFVGLDLESRNNKKRCIGRVTKNLADLTLQAGLLADSLNLYHAASETLNSVNDSLWFGAAQEGLCAVSSILLYPHLRETETFHRNASLQPTPMSSSSSSVSSILNSSSTSSLSNSAGSNSTNLPTNALHPDDIPQCYRKAIINYSKYSHAGIIETEAALKAARICVEQNKNLDVCMFLQNILFINVNMTELERIKRFEVLTEIYEQIGYKRKAAFCRRLAAWKCVYKGIPIPDWQKSYKLMLDSFPGYLLSLDPLEVIDNNAGWPTLQIDLMNSLISAANRIGHSHSALATRHMTFLLQTQWDNMSLADQKERALQLQGLSSQCEGSPVPLVLENGIVIPPANLTDIPYCIQIQVMDLENYMRPHKIVLSKNDSGPFIFTPIHNYSSIDRREKARSKDTKVDFYWVQNDKCTVTIKLQNNLPFELTVSDMRLLTNGIVFEALPSTIILHPSTPTTVKLHGTPLEVGALEIQGFSTHTLGVKSNCRLKHMKKRKFPNTYIVDVIPALPKISAQTTLEIPPTDLLKMPGTVADNIICSAYISLYNGESSECTVTLRNDSLIPIEHLDISMSSNVDNELIKKILQFDENEIQAHLPIKPNTEIKFKVDIFAEADFLCPLQTVSHGPQSLGFSNISSGHASLPSRMSSPLPKRGSELTSSFRSTNSSSLNYPNSHHSMGNPNAQVIDAFIKIRYSGGEAMASGFCRQCTIRFNLELLQSAQITAWDVLPAETASQFYLVIDVSNLTTQEMSLNYTENKNILIEAQESCRVPIPVDRCEIDESTLKRSDELVENENGIYTPPPSLQEVTANACSVHIADRVKLKWGLTGSDNQGTASLRGITLSPAMMDLIAVSPLQWVVTFDNTPVQPQSEVVCKVGQSVNLSITVTNQSMTPLKQLSLSVQFYQDYLNRLQYYNLETRVTMSGSNQTIIPILEKEQSASHECTIVFFTPGRFKANIQCKSLESSESGVKSNLPNGHINFQLPQPGGNLGFSEIQSQQAHLWKFIPPIELTVLE